MSGTSVSQALASFLGRSKGSEDSTMESVPKPPEDNELRTIIDKLANFVARNGPDFEHMTKMKQKGNPKFNFLFGGEYYNYYSYKVASESHVQQQTKQKLEQQQAIIQEVITQQSIQSAPWQQIQQQPPQVPPTVAATVPPPAQTPITQPPPSAIQQAQLVMQKQEIKRQIGQSEENLKKQHQVLLKQQQEQIDAALVLGREQKLQDMAAKLEIPIDDFESKLQAISDSCTKDAISAGKQWIFSTSKSKEHCRLIAQHLLVKILPKGMEFQTKLHMIYLINDVLHHCVRRGADELQLGLSEVVVPIFCSTHISAGDEQRQKMDKVLNLWKTNKYFSELVIKDLESPATSLSSFQASQIEEFQASIQKIQNDTNLKMQNLQKQHDEFVTHMEKILQQHQQQIQQQQQQQQQAAVTTQQQIAPTQSTPTVPPPTQQHSVASSAPPPTVAVAVTASSVAMTVPQQQQVPVVSTQAPASSGAVTQMTQPPQGAPVPFSGMQPSIPSQLLTGPPPPPGQPPPDSSFMPKFDPSVPPPGFPNMPPPPFQPVCSGEKQESYGMPPPPGPPPHGPPPNFPTHLPPPMNVDFSRPPPGFGPPPDFPPPPPMHGGPPMPMPTGPPDPNDPSLMPKVPYYDLPAGLMAPLVKLEDTEYEPLDPDDIRLPPPQPPSERLLAAVEAFYAPPSRDAPRNSDGWEQNGLFEFFKAKQKYSKMKKDRLMQERERERDRGYSPRGRRGRSRSRSPRSRSRSRSRSPQYRRQSPPRRSSPSRRSPPPRRMSPRQSPPRRRTPPPGWSLPQRSGQRSPQRSPSPGPRRRFRSRSRSRSRSGSESPPYQRTSRSRSKSPPMRHLRSRSPSPPSRYRRGSVSPPPSSFHRRSPSRSPPPRARRRSRSRSPSPYHGVQAFYETRPDDKLAEDNKGAMLMKKMGWSGKGLGANEQGIVDPISGGEVREKMDMYKGIGLSINDPFESFRKSKSQTFINRMRSRDGTT